MDEAHDIEIMRRTLDMMSLDRLNRLNDIEELRRRLDHPRLPLHVGKGKFEAEGEVDFHVH